MIKFLIVLSLAFYSFYIFFLLVLLFQKRKQALVSKKIKASEFKDYQFADLPKELHVHSRHVDNQFQVPMIFMVCGAVILSLKNPSFLFAILMWLFVVSRLVHSKIHLGQNNVIRRAQVYGLGWLIIFIIWILLLFEFSQTLF